MDKKEIPKNPYMHHRRKHALPPIDWLIDRYSYDKRTGSIYGKNKNRPLANKCSDGYITITIRYNGQSIHLKGQRLAFALKTKRWPHMVNHLDSNRANNRWTNLEETTAAGNALHRVQIHAQTAHPDDSADLRAQLAGETARADAAERAREQAEADRDKWQRMAEKLAERPRFQWPWNR